MISVLKENVPLTRVNKNTRLSGVVLYSVIFKFTSIHSASISYLQNEIDSDLNLKSLGEKTVVYLIQ